MKTCTKCKKVKPLDEFSKDKTKQDGRCSNCKSCRKDYLRRNSDKIKAQQRAYYRANVDYMIERSRKYREENAERIREYNWESWRKNAERYRERKRAYMREYYPENKDKFRHGNAIRRARKRAATVNPFTTDDVVRVWGENPICIYCQERSAEHKDHFNPLARGGDHSLANATWPACAPCNLRKRDRHPFEFIATELMNDQQRKEFAEALMRRTNVDRDYRKEGKRQGHCR